MFMITKATQIKQIDRAEENKISLYYLKQAEPEIKRGNIKINVLYSLLIEEINKHNAVIKRKVSTIRSQGTID